MGNPPTIAGMLWVVPLLVIALFVFMTVRDWGRAPTTLMSGYKATPATFSVVVPVGLAPTVASGQDVVLLIAATGESFTVWASPVSSTSSCSATLSARTAQLPGMSTTIEIAAIAGISATGVAVTTTPTEHVLACAVRNDMRYVINYMTTMTYSRFQGVMETWRWI